MPSFQSDYRQEQILAHYLDGVYSTMHLNSKRIKDINLQYRGIDLILTHNKKTYYIDEKAQLHYINQSLNTFTFELSYIGNEGNLRKGWLFDFNKITQFYFLITGIRVKNKKILSKPEDIDSLQITSVNRRKLLRLLLQLNLTEQVLENYISSLRQKGKRGLHPINELHPKMEGNLYFSPQLREQPVNLQLKLAYLIQKGCAKNIYPK